MRPKLLLGVRYFVQRFILLRALRHDTGAAREALIPTSPPVVAVHLKHGVSQTPLDIACFRDLLCHFLHFKLRRTYLGFDDWRLICLTVTHSISEGMRD